MGEDDDGLWEKPSWAKGGVKLKKTGKADKMKTDGNLAAPITFTPYKKANHSNTVANQERLRKTEVGDAVKSGESLAAPITFTPFKNSDHTNKVANKSRLGSMHEPKGNRKSKTMDAPLPPAFKTVRIQRLAFAKQQDRRKNNDKWVSLNSQHPESSVHEDITATDSDSSFDGDDSFASFDEEDDEEPL